MDIFLVNDKGEVELWLLNDVKDISANDCTVNVKNTYVL